MSDEVSNSDTSVIVLKQLGKHNMKKYEFKKIDPSDIVVKQNENTSVESTPTPSQVSIIQSSLEKELIEKLLSKSDDLSNSLNNFQMQFEKLQEQSQEREKSAREEGLKEGEMKAKLAFSEELDKEREKIAKSIAMLDSVIENIKSQVVKLENELSTIALDIAKEVIIKEVDANSAKIATLISKELLQLMSSNLNITIKINPLDFDIVSNDLKDKENIKIKRDDAVSRGGVIVIGDDGNLDGNVMSRYNLLKQSVLENFR